jgi:hypothetical protein
MHVASGMRQVSVLGSTGDARGGILALPGKMDV